MGLYDKIKWDIGIDRAVKIRNFWRRLIIRKIIGIDDYIVNLFFLFNIILS